MLDVTGPAAVFGAANEGRERPVYEVEIVSPDGGAVASNCGVSLVSRRLGGRYDTLLVAGGSRGLKAVLAREDVRRWLRRVAPQTRRFGSVCTGAFEADALLRWSQLRVGDLECRFALQAAQYRAADHVS